MILKHSCFALAFVLATGCVDERSPGGGDDDGSGSGSGSTVDESWLPSAAGAALAADDAYVYFSTGAALSRVPVGGGTPEQLYVFVPTAQHAAISSIELGPSSIVFKVSEMNDDLTNQKLHLFALDKAGGTPVELSSSQDSRAYLGMTIDGPDAYFSSFTSLYRVPLTGGTIKFVGESPNSTRYWVFTPTIIGNDLYWCELAGIYKIAKTASSSKGTLFSGFAGGTTILGATPTSLVVGVAAPEGLYNPPSKVALVDLATGATTTPVDVGDAMFHSVVAGDDVYAATASGLIRVPLNGGAPVHITSTPSWDITANSEAVYVSSNTGITRVAL